MISYTILYYTAVYCTVLYYTVRSLTIVVYYTITSWWDSIPYTHMHKTDTCTHTCCTWKIRATVAVLRARTICGSEGATRATRASKATRATPVRYEILAGFYTDSPGQGFQTRLHVSGWRRKNSSTNTMSQLARSIGSAIFWKILQTLECNIQLF